VAGRSQRARHRMDMSVPSDFSGNRSIREASPMHYEGDVAILIAAALFATGVWVESQDDHPQPTRAALWGIGFVLVGALILALIDRYAVLP
jgi:hypothetical protein